MVSFKYICIGELRDYYAKLQSLDSLDEEVRECAERMDGIRSATSDATPVKGGSSGRLEHLINSIANKEVYEDNLEIARRQVRRVEKGLSGLNAKQRRILDLFYMRREYGYIQRLCQEFNESEREVYRDKDDALMRYTLCRYGLTEL